MFLLSLWAQFLCTQLSACMGSISAPLTLWTFRAKGTIGPPQSSNGPLQTGRVVRCIGRILHGRCLRARRSGGVDEIRARARVVVFQEDENANCSLAVRSVCWNSSFSVQSSATSGQISAASVHHDRVSQFAACRTHTHCTQDRTLTTCTRMSPIYIAPNGAPDGKQCTRSGRVSRNHSEKNFWPLSGEKCSVSVHMQQTACQVSRCLCLQRNRKVTSSPGQESGDQSTSPLCTN